MSQITIRRSHALSPIAARERISHVADRLTERFGATCRWQGDVLHIEHASVRGQLTLEAEMITVEAKLGLALAFFSGKIEAEIARILDRELGA
ncbi:MAG: polyhydroxyalkanoic acid system family protein [Pseudomonadota bacterium]